MDWKKKFEVAGLGGAKSSRIIVHQTNLYIWFSKHLRISFPFHLPIVMVVKVLWILSKKDRY